MKCPAEIKRLQSRSGFTLIEILVTLSLFAIIMAIAGTAFNRIISESSKYSNLEESNIEGMIGLEIMRHDLEQSGFGLPWGWLKGDPPASGSTPPSGLIDSTITYNEAADAPQSALNDATSGIPRAVVGNAKMGQFSSAYIAIKGTTVGRTKASQRWTHIGYHNYSSTESRPVVYSGKSPDPGDKVIMVTSNFNTEALDHMLIVDPNDNAVFYQNYSLNNMSDNFLPTDELQTYMVYGIDSDTNPRMPFNRSDFFIKIPSGSTATGDGALPPFCAPKTGVLYKGTLKHSNGKYNYIPLLDCVADMQVVLGWDSSDAGSAGKVDVYSTLPDASGAVVTSVTSLKSSVEGFLTDAKQLREHLKIVKVYILAQEGKKDARLVSPVSTIEVGDHLTDGIYPARNYALSTDQKKYRWKLYRIVARPKNLTSNQR